MSRVRQRGTKAERSVAAVLRDLGLNYRLNVRSLPGSPDFANRAGRWVIFVHGCFWHQHRGCPRATVPKRNREFWSEKFEAIGAATRAQSATCADESCASSLCGNVRPQMHIFCVASYPSSLNRVVYRWSSRSIIDA